jgi:hypothetical protein
MIRAGAAVLGIALLAACSRPPAVFTPPAQFRAPSGPDAPVLRNLIDMADPAAEFHLVRGVERTPAPEGWRWTGPGAELWFALETPAGRDFLLDFAIAEQSFRVTGPVQLTVAINGHLLDRPRYGAHGRHEFRRRVSAEWLRALDINQVEIECDPPWREPATGTSRGILLFRAGFVVP